MRILAVSDSHGNGQNIKRALRQAGKVDALLHAGDGGNDLPQVDAPCFAVRGNCDWVSDLPMELLLPLGGKRIFLCHGHGYGVKNGLLRLFYRAREQGADYAVFGHTHHSLIAQREGIFLVNPGSIGAFYGKGGPTFALLDTESAGRCDILTLD